jgi:predicted PurR-regulated permease PerM
MNVPTPPAPQDDAPTPTPTPPPAPAPGVPRPRASTSLVVLAVLAVAYTLWAAQEIILPVLLAMFFALVGNPIIRGLHRLLVPRFVAAVLVLAGGLAAFGALGTQLVRPAAEWIQEAPWQMRQVGRELRDLTRPVLEANRAAENIARAAGSVTIGEVEVVRTQIDDPYGDLAKAPKLLATLLAVVLLTLFFMVFGEHLQRNALALLPTRQRQKLTAGILASIEREISRYVFTISLINVLVGLLYAALLHWLLDVAPQDALLWGTMVALLNFAPYVGPLIGVGMMLLMGFVTFDGLWPSLLPAAIYLALHTIEGQIITPIVLGRRMHLSPLVLVLALMVFGWLWGIVGLLLAVPLLVCVKLVLAKIEGMEGWARLLE